MHLRARSGKKGLLRKDLLLRTIKFLRMEDTFLPVAKGDSTSINLANEMSSYMLVQD